MTKAGQKISHVHKKVAEVAKSLAEESYELIMSNNLVRAEWKRQHPGMPERGLIRAFVSRNWARYIPMARTTLGLLLREPIDEKLKEEILDILAKDQTLIRGRKDPKILAGSMPTAPN